MWTFVFGDWFEPKRTESTGQAGGQELISRTRFRSRKIWPSNLNGAAKRRLLAIHRSSSPPARSPPLTQPVRVPFQIPAPELLGRSLRSRNHYHITSGIGAAIIGWHDCAMLRYPALAGPKEHLGLPNKKDAKDAAIVHEIPAGSEAEVLFPFCEAAREGARQPKKFSGDFPAR